MLQRNSRFGLHERVGRDVVMYPFGEMFRGVSLTDEASKAATAFGPDFARAVALILVWMLALLLVASFLEDVGRRDAADWVMTFGAAQVFLLFPLQKAVRVVLCAPRSAWTSDSPIDRERAGRLIVPPYSIATLLVCAVCAVALAAMSYAYWTKPPPKLNETQTMAKVASTAEFTVLTFALFARMIWRNLRSASIARTRGATGSPGAR